MTVLFIVLQSLLALYYVFSGTAKTIGAKYWVDIFNNLGIHTVVSCRHRRRPVSRCRYTHHRLLVFRGGNVGLHLAWNYDVTGVPRAFQGQRSDRQNGTGPHVYCFNHHANHR